MKNKQGNTKLIFIIVVVALLIAAVYYFGFRSANVGGANLGYGQIAGVDGSGNLIITYAVSSASGPNGCAGLSNTNSLTKEQCEKYGWTYNPDKAGILGGTCGVYSGIDLTKFDYTVSNLCSYSCYNTNDCPPSNPASNNPSFEGSQICWGWITSNQISCKGTITVFPHVIPSATQPINPQPSGFVAFINSIFAWLKSIFNNIFGIASIQGMTVVQPGTSQTYNINLTAPVPNSNYSSGLYSLDYSNWALIDINGNVISQGTWTQTYGNYIQSVTLTIPQNPGNYVLIAVTTENDATYDYVNKIWTFKGENIVAKEAINLQSKYVIVAPSIPQPLGFIASFIQSIVNWFRNLFNI